MRIALIAAVAGLTACGGQPESAGPERRSAAGEVLGGEVTDDMLPLDTARSTSPPDPRAGAPDGAATPAPTGKRSVTLPKPQLSGGPQPDSPSPPGREATDAPTEE